MKRYNLSEIMKKAHNFHKTGKYTWSESLRKSWKMAKFSVQVKEEIAGTKDYKEADNRAFTARLKKEYGSQRKEKRSSYDYFNYPASVYYTNNCRGFYGSNYMGD